MHMTLTPHSTRKEMQCNTTQTQKTSCIIHKRKVHVTVHTYVHIYTLTWKLLWSPDPQLGLLLRSPRNPVSTHLLQHRGGGWSVSIYTSRWAVILFHSHRSRNQSHSFVVNNRTGENHLREVVNLNIYCITKQGACIFNFMEERLRVVSVSLAQVVLLTEKRSPPGASCSTTEPTIMAISMYTVEVTAMARNVPLGMAFWGSCTEQCMGWSGHLDVYTCMTM